MSAAGAASLRRKKTADAPEDIFALYGLKQTLKFDGPLMNESMVDVLDSSQEDSLPQEDSPPPKFAFVPCDAPKGKGESKGKLSQAWIDECKKSLQVIVACCVDPVARCSYRLLQDGQRVNAAMSAGPRGFALATFPGEEPVETELPNVILQAPVRARKAQAKGKAKATNKSKPQKGKAKAKKSVKASSSKASAAEIESSDEEETEEDLEEEDEAVEADEEPDPEVERKWSSAEIAELKQRGFAHAGKLGQLKLTQGSKQTYFVSPNSSPALVCSVSLQQSLNHVDVCCTVLDFVIKKNLDKEGALLLRKQLLDA